MKHIVFKTLFIIGLVAAGWAWSGELLPTLVGNFVATAEAVRGRPVTPVSYSGVARRSTVGAGAPGAGITRGAGPGAGARGAGVTRGAGVGARGAGAAPGNRGGPVNRVGRR